MRTIGFLGLFVGQLLLALLTASMDLGPVALTQASLAAVALGLYARGD